MDLKQMLINGSAGERERLTKLLDAIGTLMPVVMANAQRTGEARNTFGNAVWNTTGVALADLAAVCQRDIAALDQKVLIEKAVG